MPSPASGRGSVEIRVGGVPEHFNYPWHASIEGNGFARRGLDVAWKDVKEGTGALLSMLQAGELDVVVALTEGLVKEIAKGGDLTLISSYVDSPLCWAISTGANSAVQSVADLQDQAFAVSRMTSGSHLMSYVLGSQQGWDVAHMEFQVRGDFTKLRNAVNDDSDPSEAFLWETFTTKPFHDSGEIRRVGDISSPWPAFMIATTKGYARQHAPTLQAMLEELRVSCASFMANYADAPLVIAERYGLEAEDARKWYKGVRITASSQVPGWAIERASAALVKVGVLSEDAALIPPRDFVDGQLCSIAEGTAPW